MNEELNKDSLITRYMHIFAYYDESNQKVAAVNLWLNGHRILHGATIIKNFEGYKEMVLSFSINKDIQRVWPFIDDNIIDHTRIITCFENFMKGYLILNNYVVHKLTNKNKALKNAQLERPILKTEIFTENSFININTNKPDILETSEQSINFSWLLKPEYQKIINLPSDIYTIIKDLNNERNKLHFISNEGFEFGKHTIDKYEKIIDFAENIIKPAVQNLDKELKKIRSLKSNQQVPPTPNH